MMARRVGFVLTPSRRSSASGWIVAATIQNAGADGSAGTVSSNGSRVAGPARRDEVPVAGRSRRSPDAAGRHPLPCASRVATASETTVSPSAARAARRIADFTWRWAPGWRR